MPQQIRNFALPGKIDSYLATLNRLYERESESLLREIVVNGVVSIHEGWDYDNWNGGTYGHAVTLTLPEDVFLRAIHEKDGYQAHISQDLNKLNNCKNEDISCVFFEINTVEQESWREQSGVYRPPSAPQSIPSDALERIWDGFHVRVFLSHKATKKIETSRLKQSFADCGIGAFVAHDDIEPTEEWHREIERALFSMDALVSLLTEDFHDSDWTDQEVGVAIGRGVPLVAVMLGRDPYGLMGKGQGLGGCSRTNPNEIALKVFQLLLKRLPDKSRLFECALASYANSVSFADSAWRIERVLSQFHELTQTQVDRVLQAFCTNNQNRSSFKGRDLLLPLLKRWTGKEWIFQNNDLVLQQPVETKDDAPF